VHSAGPIGHFVAARLPDFATETAGAGTKDMKASMANRTTTLYKKFGKARFKLNILTAAVLIASSTDIHAEGVVQMGIGQNLLDYEASLGQGYAADDTSASVYIDVLTAGEVINVSLCGSVNTDAITVEFYAPSNNATPIDTQSIAGSNVDCADPMDAPLTNPMRHITTESGAYRMVLQNTTQASFANSKFLRYDFTVTPDATTNPDPTAAGGRFWGYTFGVNAGSFDETAATDANYYALIPGGRPSTNYVWQLDLNNFAGYGYNLVANSVGVRAPNSSYSTETTDNGVDYQHPLYLSYPAISDPRPTTAPTLTDVRFVDSDGDDYGISPGATVGVQDSGFFEFVSDVPGTYSILIDLNQDGIYGNAGDRQLLGEAVTGFNQVLWDGNDAAGNAPATGVYYSKVEMHMGEYHFIANDVETSGGTESGLTINLANPDGTTIPARVYWDDITLLNAGGTSNTPEGALSNTPEGKHTWGNFTGTGFGNQRYIDTYVYGLSTIHYSPAAVVDGEGIFVNYDGTVTVNTESQPGDQLDIVVSDQDLNTDAAVIETTSVAVVNDASGESETVVLTETGSDTSIFTGSLPTTPNNSIDDDGMLSSTGGDTITINYVDLIGADLTSHIRTATNNVLIDTDADGIADLYDTDDDDDGISDVIEGNADTDNDGVINSLDTDSDDDGISDASEGTTDTDGDGFANYIDADSDADNIPDAIEGVVDTDNDGVANYLETDSDNDGISDTTEGIADPDADGLANYVDLDSDGDGIGDGDEGTADIDADGLANYVDTDSDGDGIDDVIEGSNDLDGDNIPNNLDTDSDGDGINDIDEGVFDTDADGQANYLDTDSDNDGINDNIEGTGDTDADGVADYLETDSDGDGIGDSAESTADADNDGIPNYQDIDSDGDGIDDSNEGVLDIDGDSLPNYLDGDADGDGINDSAEAPNAPITTDTDADGIPDYQDLDSDGDGINDSVEAGTDAANPADTDGDGLPDFIDTDSDGDGLDDALEGTVDSDGDGIADLLDSDSNDDEIADADAGNGDADNDGIPNFLDNDIDGDGIPNIGETANDADGDNIPNYLDLDSDNDGIDDSVEGTTDSEGDGLPNFLDVDSDGDGLPDTLEAGDNPNLPLDSDGDSIPDYLDEDSDADGINDIIEANGGNNDNDADGIPNVLDLDSDGDGIPDNVEQGQDTDGDGTPDFIDTDSDGDGIGDALESDVDTDADGIPDFQDTDADGDGNLDINEGTSDQNADGVPNYLDLDSDGDGIPDSVEVGDSPNEPSDSDADGVPDYLDTDSDGDGIDDAAEAGTNPGAPSDTDNDGVPDFLDTDSDGDSVSDSDEGTIDTDGDGVIDALDPDTSIANPVTGVPPGEQDTDNDGIADSLDADIDGDGIPNDSETDADTDGDGISNEFDIDSDGDGINDNIEGTGDVDGDGTPNYLDTDSDADGISDAEEAGDNPAQPIDTDGNAQPDYLDADSDGDGITDAVEGSMDSDADGTADYLDSDADNDGIPDSIEGAIDTDGDGTADFIDTDSDNDGDSDSSEAGDIGDTPIDSDQDGIPDYIDTSTNTISPFNPAEPVDNTVDSDADGVADIIDLDDDNDGIPDAIEIGGDANNPVDTDGDGVPDFLDRDSDNDGITDSTEAHGVDTDGNGIIDEFTDTNNDGLDDLLSITPLNVDDFDNDGVPDFQDLDSDNDGLSDLFETTGASADIDFDGRIDNFTDNDQDGIDDSVALEPVNEVDTDNDGWADQLDLDRDNDGQSDLEEAGGIDVNGDGIVDELQDSDSDGIPDSVDVDNTGGVDADEDGIDDSADADFVTAEGDSDSDGIIDSADPDSEGDGFVQTGFSFDPLQPLGSNLPDTDGDGVPDISQAVNANGDLEWHTGVAGSGCSIDSTGKAKSDTGLLAVLIMAVAGFLFRTIVRASGRTNVQKNVQKNAHTGARQNAGKLTGNQSSLLIVLASVLGLSACASNANTRAADARPQSQQDQLGRHVYAGFGIGSSALNPVPRNSDNASVTESRAMGVQINLGLDINKWTSLELHGASLGNAELSTGGSIGYQNFGGSALFYLGKNRHKVLRNGLSAYGRIGYGLTNNTTQGDVNLIQDHKAALLAGAGVEYSSRKGLGVRAEFYAYEEDVNYLQLGLIYRFGKNADQKPLPQITKHVEPAPAVAPAPMPVPKPVPAVVITKPADEDNDGVLDAADKCAGTISGAAINALGCALLAGVIDGVNFPTKSAELTSSAKASLDEVTAKLQLHPTLSFELAAHTDDIGTTQANALLAKQRALSVAKYLLQRGVAKQRFKVKAYGESQPVASNATENGRQKNRRVELMVLRQQ